MSTRPLALLWDNDGVLVDTERLYFQATCELLASVGATLDEAQYVEFFLRQGTGAWHLARERGLDEVQVAALKVARNARYAELLAAGSLMLPGVASALTILAARYRMAVVTTSATDHFEIIHRSTQLLPHFEFCLTRSDYVRSKPDPEPYRLAVSRLGLAPAECLVIEDSQRGLYAALAAGLRCWIVPSHFTRSEDFTGAERVFPDIAAVAAALCSDGAVDR